MDAFRVGIGEPIFVLTKALDRFLQLRPGEVVRAQVVDVMPNGDVSLRIKGNLIQAKSSLDLPLNATVTFRVVGQQTGESGAELRLQFLEMTSNSDVATTSQGAAATSQSGSANLVQTLAQELAANLSAGGEIAKDITATVEQLLKALPDNITALPKDVREQLQNLVQTSLRNTDESIQNRLSLLLNEPVLAELPQLVDLVGVKEQLFTDMDKTLQVPLRFTLENTGVSLESRLGVLAQSLPDEGEVALAGESSSASMVRQSSDGDVLQTDLKAKLLQMKQTILEQDRQLASDLSISRGADAKEITEQRNELSRTLQSVDGLLQDIETFQLLSKLTDSFYTFLPVVWKGLKEADIAFKRSGSAQEGKSYYCLMNLDFEELGKVTIVAMMQGGDFVVSFKTDNNEFRSVLNSNLQELQQMFREQGLNLKTADVLGVEENHLMPFERLESFENIINIRI
jgi:hypothetical protein